MRYAEVQRKDLIDRKAPNNERQIIPPTIISKKKNRHISDNDKYNPERSYLHHKISQEQYEKISSE